MEPISTVIATALAAGAAAGLADTASQIVKDAYAGLKDLIQRKYAKASAGLEILESEPASAELQAYAGKQLAASGATADPEVQRLAQALLEAVQREAPEAARTIGVDLQGIRAGSLKLADILAQGSESVTGVQARDVEVAGELSISGVRVTSGQAPASPTPQPGPGAIKVLFLAANPTATTRLRLDAEVRAIDQALRLAQYRDVFDLEQAHAVRVGDLQGLLMRYGPHIVHFSGHGSPAGEIILEDEAGHVQRVSAPALSTVFALLKDNIRCVVLNACFSLIQATAIAQHIDCVLGMSMSIEDQAATNFAAAFYQALGYGRSVKAAFELGCNQIDLAGLSGQDLPQLLATHVDAAQVVLTR